MMKKILFAILILLLVVLGGLIYVASQAGDLMQKATLKYGPEITGSAIELDDVDVSFLDGSASLDDLIVRNPAGFNSAYAFKVDDVDIKLDVMSVTAEVIRIKEIRINGAGLIYELSGKGDNIGALQKNVENYMTRFGAQDTSDSTVKFIIDDIYITGTKVELASKLLGGRDASLVLPDLHLEQIGNEDKAATGAEVAKKVLGAINNSLGKVVTRDMLDDAFGEVGDKLKDIIFK